MAAQTTAPEALRGQGVDAWASGDAAAILSSPVGLSERPG
jgi:hypothetical protein